MEYDIVIKDNQDDWMEFWVDGYCLYSGHPGSFNNSILKDILEKLLPDCSIIHDDNPDNFQV